ALPLGPPLATLFPYATLFRSWIAGVAGVCLAVAVGFAFVGVRSHVSRSTSLTQRTHSVELRMARARPGVTATEVDALRPDRYPSDRKSTRLNSSHVKISYAVV